MDPKRYQVFWGDELVLDLVDEPGLLISKLAPPPLPGTELVHHPFLSAVAYVPEHDGALREALDQSLSTDDYLAILHELGYRVIEA